MDAHPRPRATGRHLPKCRRAGSAVATICICLVPLAACDDVDSPVMLDERGLQQAALVDDGRADSVDIRAAPTFTPFTDAPSIRNRDEVISAMTRAYPPLLRDAGVGGTVRVYFFINEKGVAEQVRLDQSSGHDALDEAALNVAGIYQFSPAERDGMPVPVWVSFPITFQVR